MAISIGKVIAVRGTEIVVAVDEHANMNTVFHEGVAYNGVSIRELIIIRRGFFDIVCVVEGEYLDERFLQGRIEANSRDETHQTLQDPSAPLNVRRRVQVKPIGHFLGDDFIQGLKYMPMIYDQAYLMSSQKVTAVFARHTSSEFIIGNLLKEELKVSLPWQTLFNSHVGIFGNTGSGKSNTLAKIYTTLFDSRAKAMKGKSRFVILDFNGEYVGDQLVETSMKQSVKLSTQQDAGKGRWQMSSREFWDTEVLSILFQATKATQRPFIQRVVNGQEKYILSLESSAARTRVLRNYTEEVVARSLSGESRKGDAKKLLETALKIWKKSTDSLKNKDDSYLLKDIEYHNSQEKYRIKDINGGKDIYGENPKFEEIVRERIADFFIEIDGDKELTSPDPLGQFLLNSYLRLADEITIGHVQVDHVHPMLKRAEASIGSLRKVLEVDESLGINSTANKLVQVISLRDCDTDIKKLLPIVIAKGLYDNHKKTVSSSMMKTCHLIIDEAHNILSSSSNSEHETWRDYRLELFEEIIKEGRKFGFFLTLSSQRPADISPTIISQVHNYFIHRLVNERDLKLLETSVSSLDAFSRAAIPNLSKGSCVVTGTSFEMPMLIQVDLLERSKQPDSHDVDLESLWSSSSGESN